MNDGHFQPQNSKEILQILLRNAEGLKVPTKYENNYLHVNEGLVMQ